MNRISRLLSRLLGAPISKRSSGDLCRRPNVQLLEDRTAPATLIQVANVDGFVSDVNLDLIFDSVNTTGGAIQTSNVAASGATIDQSNAATPWSMSNIRIGALPMGQEFRPTQSSLSFVDMFIEDAGSDIGPGANFNLMIRSGTIDGAVVGTATAFVPDGTNTGGGSTYTRFNFATPLSLTPEATYVIQVIQTSTGTGVGNYMLVSDVADVDTYTRGRAIFSGVPSSNMVDFLFKEGTSGTPGLRERGVMEFSTAGITSSSVINSVTLTGSISLAQPGITGGVNVSFLVYSGNGQITTADATASIFGYGAITNAGVGSLTLNFDPNMIQSLIRSAGYGGYIGIRMELSSGQRIFLTSTENPAAAPPTLTINYDGPAAFNDTFRINQGETQLSIAAPGVLANDTHPVGTGLTAVLVGAPRTGSVVLAADGSFIYTPNGQFSTTDTFTYRALMGSVESNVATVTIRINRPPVTFSRSYLATMNTTLNVSVSSGVLSNNHDPDFDPFTAILISGPSHGQLTLNSNGSFVYIPDAGYSGPDQFTFVANDGMLSSSVATASIFVNGLPVAQNDSYSVDQSTVLNVAAPGVLANDTDGNGDPLGAILVTNPAHGTLIFSANGGFQYTPTPGYFGNDSFTYRVTDSHVNSGNATVSITVNQVNHAPIAVDDAYSMNEDAVLTLNPTPGPTTLTMTSQPGDYIGQGRNYSFSNLTGTFTGNGNMNNVHFSYFDTLNPGVWWFLDFAAPAGAALTPGFYANATRYPFQAPNVPGLSVVGEGRGSNGLTGNFTVHEATFTANGNVGRFHASFEQHSEGAPPALFGEINFNKQAGPSGVLINDSDADGDMLSSILVAGPSHGTLTLNPDGTFTYRPHANYSGTDSFTYKANDGFADSNIATVVITINPLNDAPVAVADSYATDEDTPLTVAAAGVLANDSDVDGDTLAALLVNGPSHGSLTLNTNGSFTYTPAGNYNGPDSFTYRANDGSLSSSITTVSLTVRAVNDVPLANDDNYDTDEDTPLTVALPGVLANDTDVEAGPLSAILVTGPANGQVVLNSNGSFTYTPNANFRGNDRFTYKANDGSADGNVAAVFLTINSVNDAPNAADDAYSVNEDSVLTVPAPGVLGNDSDIEGGALTALLVSGPSNGNLALAGDGSFIYTPNANYNGGDSFTYRANDGSADSNLATVTLTIVSVNNAPTANAGDDQTASEGAGVAFNGLASTDIDGDALSYSWTFGDGGTSSGPTPSHVYLDNGVYTATLTVSDGQATHSDTLIVTVNNVAPTATLSGPPTGVRGQARTFMFGASDPSVVDQAAPFTFSINWGDGATQVVSGPAASQADHTFTSTGTYTVTVTATDKDGGTSLVTQQSIIIKAVDVQGTALAIGGTTGGDSIVIKPASSSGSLNVTINGVSQGTFARPGQLLVFAQAGDDNILFDAVKIQGKQQYVTAPAVVLAGAGDDTIDARDSKADNILIGGAGADTVRGGGADDIVIGGTTDFDDNSTALLAMLADWSREDISYATRVAHLDGTLPGGLNGGFFLTVATVHDDAAIDQLYGEGGVEDWFFALMSGPFADNVQDEVSAEFIVSL